MSITIRPATQQDVAAIVRLLADDVLGAKREKYADPLPEAYYSAFDAINSDKNNTLIIAQMNNKVVGTLQLTYITYLTYQGGKRAIIEGVRVDSNVRGSGVGKAMINWAISKARADGCHVVQLTTDKQRPLVASKLLNQQVIGTKRLNTSNMNYVFAIKTATNGYVLRMTDQKYKRTYEAAIYWQKFLLPLGIPIVEFIASDLEGKYSPYPAVLMHLIPGDDLCNVYKQLSTDAKHILAQQMVDIFAKADKLPVGVTYGFADNYEQPTTYSTWYDFLDARLELCRQSLAKTDAFPNDVMSKIYDVAKGIQSNLNSFPAKPFLWDASERNVLVYQDQISGIVDVDNMCFGDPLFTLGLTYIGLEVLGCDDIYCDTWAGLLQLAPQANLRLQFYRLFYTVWFMRHYADQVSENGTAYNMDADTLNKLFIENLAKIHTLLTASKNA